MINAATFGPDRLQDICQESRPLVQKIFLPNQKKLMDNGEKMNRNKSRVAQGNHTPTLSQVGLRTGAVSHRLPLAVSAVSSFVPG